MIRVTESQREKGYQNIKRGACSVMVIIGGNGHGDASSNPGRD